VPVRFDPRQILAGRDAPLDSGLPTCGPYCRGDCQVARAGPLGGLLAVIEDARRRVAAADGVEHQAVRVARRCPQDPAAYRRHQRDVAARIRALEQQVAERETLLQVGEGSGHEA
jgi:hypothetical protein